MRIIGTIEHQDLKITVFKMDERITVKFENPVYEVGIKLGANPQLDNIEAVRNWVDTVFVEAIQHTIAQLHQSRLGADSRRLPYASISEFEEII